MALAPYLAIDFDAHKFDAHTLYALTFCLAILQLRDWGRILVSIKMGTFVLYLIPQVLLPISMFIPEVVPPTFAYTPVPTLFRPLDLSCTFHPYNCLCANHICVGASRS